MRYLIVVVVAILLIAMTFYAPNLLNRTFGNPPDPVGIEALPGDSSPVVEWFGTPYPHLWPRESGPIIPPSTPIPTP